MSTILTTSPVPVKNVNSVKPPVKFINQICIQKLTLLAAPMLPDGVKHAPLLLTS